MMESDVQLDILESFVIREGYCFIRLDGEFHVDKIQIYTVVMLPGMQLDLLAGGGAGGQAAQPPSRPRRGSGRRPADTPADTPRRSRSAPGKGRAPRAGRPPACPPPPSPPAPPPRPGENTCVHPRFPSAMRCLAFAF